MHVPRARGMMRAMLKTVSVTALQIAAALPLGAQEIETTWDKPGRCAISTSIRLDASFTLRVCVRLAKSTKLAQLPTILSNKAWEAGAVRDYTTNNAYGLGRSSGKNAGFAISVLPDGAWTWNAGDGRRRIDHRPEARDQGIHDGRWHELGFSIDRGKGVARLYHDGHRVALHDLMGVRGLRSADSEGQLRLGSKALPGLEIAALRLTPGVLSREQVRTEFVARFGAGRAPATMPRWDGRPLRVLAWNIWHGGRRKGRDEGVKRVVELLRACEADIVLMQETYGSGPRISGRLGFDFFLRSSNLSVMSRFPIVDVHRLYQGFRFGGTTIELRPGVRIQAYSLWINHLPSVQKQLTEGATGTELATADDKTRGREIRGILKSLLPHLAKAPKLPVLVGGDFNSGSHLDWTKAAKGLSNHAGRVVAWPVSVEMERAGFRDSFRVAHPNPIEAPGHTWSPEFPKSHQDRIDYVYYRGDAWHVEDAKILRSHPRGWPSDHAASLAILRLKIR